MTVTGFKGNWDELLETNMTQTEQMLKDLGTCGKYYSYSMSNGKLLENSKQGTVIICFTLKKVLPWQDEQEIECESMETILVVQDDGFRGLEDNTVELETGSQIWNTFGGGTDKMEWKLQGVRDRIEPFRDCSWILTWATHMRSHLPRKRLNPHPGTVNASTGATLKVAASESCSAVSSSLRIPWYSP